MKKLLYIILAALVFCVADFSDELHRTCTASTASSETAIIASGGHAVDYTEYNCAITTSSANFYRSSRTPSQIATIRLGNQTRRCNNFIFNTFSFAKSGKVENSPRILDLSSVLIPYSSGHDEFIRFCTFVI